MGTPGQHSASSGEPRPGSDLRWTDLDAETDNLIRFRQHNQLCANARVTKRTITIPDHEMRVAGFRGLTPPRRESGQNSPALSRSAWARNRLGSTRCN
jgi:hypothetical protein